jgi:hypothetical protein
MNMLFIVSAGLGGTILVCQTVLSVLGLGLDHHLFPEESARNDCDPRKGDAEFVGESDLPATMPVQPGSTERNRVTSCGMARFRASAAGLTFFGLMGNAAEASRFTTLQTFTTAIAVGTMAFFGMLLLMHQTAKWAIEVHTEDSDPV